MPDGIDLKRIIDLDPETTVTDDDYTIVDSTTGGAKKFAIGQALGEIKDGLSLTDDLTSKYEHGYIALNGGIGNVVDTTVIDNVSNLHIIQECKKGDSFIITGNGGNASRLYGITDTDYKLLYVMSASATATNLLVNIEQDGYFISNVFSDRTYALTYNHYFNSSVYHALATKESVETLATSVESSITDINSILKNGYYLIPAVTNATFTNAGITTSFNSKRIRTDLISVKIGDEIYIHNGSLSHAVGAWNGEPSSATNIRNDSTFTTVDEKIISSVNGYYVVVFAKRDTTQDISPQDYDGTVELYDTLIGRESEVYNIPDYYFADAYLNSKAAHINDLAKSSDDVFIFVTDVHWERNAKNSPALINYLSNECVIPRLFDGGDLADTANNAKLAISEYATSYKNRMYRLVGNHDWFSPATGKSLYYLYNSTNYDQVGDAFGHYWYVDNVQTKIRYITLNSFVHTGNDNQTGWTYGYDAEQIAWFTNEALNVPDGYDVIIFDHWFRNKQGGYTGYTSIESAIATFNADTTNHGKVLCIFQGHAHWDAIFHTSSGVPVITTTCDKYDISNESELAEEVRTLGTINEQAFEVVVVNRTAQTITCVRIGAKAMDNIDVGRTDTGFTFAQTLEERVISYAS